MTKRYSEYMRLVDIVPATRNAKNHDAVGIDTSMGTFGMMDAPVLDERTGRLIGGHGRVEALVARQIAGHEPPEGIEVADDGQWTIPVQRGWSSRDDHHADAAGVALNRLTEKGGWDAPTLASILADVNATGNAELLASTGYSADAFTDLLARVAGPPTIEELDNRAGPPGDRDFWPVVRLVIAPGSADRWSKMLGQYEDEAAAFAALLEAWERRPTPIPTVEPTPPPEPTTPEPPGPTPVEVVEP